MLFDYYSPEMAREHKEAKIIGKIRGRLKSTLLTYLERRGSVDSMFTLSEYLVKDLDKSYSVKDLLHILAVYLSQPPSARIVNVYRKANVDYTFIVRLFLLLRAEMGNKRVLMEELEREEMSRSARKAVSMWEVNRREEEFKEDESVDKEVVEKDVNCIIAYIAHILLTIQWASISEEKKQSEEFPVVEDKRKNTVDHDSTTHPATDNFLSGILWPKLHPSFEYPQEVLLYLLFNMPKNNMELYGYEVYFALISHALSIPEVFYESSELIDMKLLEGRTIDRKKFNAIYKTILFNLKSFQVAVQKRILADVQRLSFVPEFFEVFIALDGVLTKAFDLIQEGYNSEIAEIKEGLTSIVCSFIAAYFKDSRKCEKVKEVLSAVRRLLSNTSIEVADSLVSSLLRKSEYTEALILSTTQLVYLVEDIVLIDNSSLAGESFSKLVGKLLLCLNKMEMLYLWYPLLNSAVELNLGGQRKGGVARAVFKVILGMVVFCTGSKKESQVKFIMCLLKYFLYRKPSTQNWLIKELALDKSMPLLNLPLPRMKHETGFISYNFDVQEEQKHREVVCSEEKTSLTKGHPFETYRGRVMYTFIHVFQVFIYTTYNATRYGDIGSKEVMAMKKNLVNTYKANRLAKILAKLAFDLRNSESQNILQDVVAINAKKKVEIKEEKKINNFHSGIDFFCTQYSEGLLKQNGLTFEVVSEEGSTSNSATQSDSACYKKEKIIEFFGYIKAIGDWLDSYLKRKSLKDEYIREVKKLLLELYDKGRIETLHEVTTEDFLDIELSIQKQLFHGKANDAKAHAELDNTGAKLVADTNKTLGKYRSLNTANYLTFNKRQELDKIKVAQEVKNDYKKVLAEQVFSNFHKGNQAVYRIAAKEYQKLLNKCPLFKSQRKCPLAMEQGTFVKLSFAKDNWGRQMMFREIERPLENRGVLEGLVYMRGFFLKRVMLRFIAAKRGDKLMLLGNKHKVRILRSLLSMGSERRHKQAHTLPCDWGDSRRFQADILRPDHSFFGNLVVVECGLVFLGRDKKPSGPKYLYGPSHDLQKSGDAREKVWLFQDVKKVVARKYNMIRQAVEIFLVNGKSVFLVIYPYSDLKEFITSLEKAIGAKYNIKLIKDPKEEFLARRYVDKWRKNKMSTFEYLMKLNFYSGRSTQDLSQYPVFPWTIGDYTSSELNLGDRRSFRDLKYPMAAISPYKRELCVEKYSSSDDYPGGAFQFGSHYIPGRMVLSYLMRIQPFTYLVKQFDKQDDDTSRKFHSIGTAWRKSLEDHSINYELIPEFFYNPEILSNTYFPLTDVATSTPSA